MIDETSKLRGRRVLVTGASGFIGSHLCRRLLASEAELHAVSRAKQRDSDAVQWWQADLADSARVNEIVTTTKPELIYHLASHVTGSRDLAAVLPTLQANLASTVNIMAAAATIGCPRVVLAGSLEEPEGDIVTPCSPYAAAKWAASGYARMFHSLYAMQTIGLRIAMVYGPNQSDASKLIPYTIRSLLQGEAPQLASGRREVDWIYVEDVVDAMIATADIKHDDCLSVEIGSGSGVSIGEIAERLCKLIDPSVRPILGAIADPAWERSWTADITLAQEKLNWRPRTQLGDGLRQTVAWYRRAVAGLAAV
jgi:UDP-glucose 4-epimerase